MTPEQEALVKALRTVSPTDEYNQPPLSALRHLPSVRAVIFALAAERDAERSKNATAALDFVAMLERISRERDAALAETQEVNERLRGEVELLKLRCEWQEARAESFAAQLEYAELNPDESRENVSLEVLDEADDRMMLAAEKRDAARAAYVAAGGVVLWLTNRFRCFYGARPVASGTSTWASLKPRCTTPMRANTAAWCGGRPLFRPAGFSFYLGSRTREVWCERI